MKCAYVIIMFKYVFVLCLCLQGSWPQSVRPICYHNYVQECVSCAYVYRPVGHKVYIPYFIIIMFKDVCVLCLCSQGSWPQSVQPICYHNMFKYVFPVHVFTGQLATKCAALYVIIMLKYVCVLCLCLQGSWPQSVQPMCNHNYVQVCGCPVPVFTGQLATKCTAHMLL